MSPHEREHHASTIDEWVELALDGAEAQGFPRHLDDDDACAFVAATLSGPRAGATTHTP